MKFFLIGHTYLSLIFVFSTIYFVISLHYDYKNQVSKQAYYNNINYELIQDSIARARIKEYGKSFLDTGYITNEVKYKNERAFNAIADQLWTGYDCFKPEILKLIATRDKYFEKYLDFNFETFNFQPELSFAENLRIAKLEIPTDSLIKFRQDNVANAFFNCLYFSTITTATIGYGDIAPTNTFAKLVVLIQIFCSLFLLLFSLNYTLSTWKE